MQSQGRARAVDLPSANRAPTAVDPPNPSRAPRAQTFKKLIGEGSIGRVHLGRWQETDVAIKVLTSLGNIAVGMASASPTPRAGGAPGAARTRPATATPTTRWPPSARWSARRARRVALTLTLLDPPV